MSLACRPVCNSLLCVTALKSEFNLGTLRDLLVATETALRDGHVNHIGSSCLWSQHRDTVTRLVNRLNHFQVTPVSMREDGLFNNVLNTFYLRKIMVKVWVSEMFYLTTHSTHFIYGYMASDIWLRTILIVRKETHCRHIGYSYRLSARVLLYAPSHRQDNTPRPLLHQLWSTGWNEKWLNGSTPWRIDPTTHRTMSERSTSELCHAPLFNDAHFIYGYMVSYIWLRTIQIAREKTRSCQMSYSFQFSSKGSFICTIPQMG